MQKQRGKTGLEEWRAWRQVASFPGSRAGEEEREPGTHCSRMRQVPLVTCILLRYTKITVNSAYPLKGCTAWLYSFWHPYRRFSKSKTISLRRWQSTLLHSKWLVNFKGKDCVSHVLQCLTGIHERVHNSCKQRAECPRHSFIIVHTEHGQGQAPFIQETLAYLAEVGVTEQILRKFPNSQKS